MSDFYDRYEKRAPKSRETALFRDLRSRLSVGKSRVPSLRAKLKTIDVMTLHAESRNGGPKSKQELAASPQYFTKMKGAVEFVRPGSLPNDGKIIADERNLN